jgi:hypothetical protein
MSFAAPVVATEAAVASTMTAEAIAAAEALKAAQALEAAQALQAAQAAQATATAANAATNQSVLQAIGASPAAPASAAQLGGYGGANAIGAGTGAAGGIPTLGTGAGTGANLGYETLAKEVGTGGIKDIVAGMGENQIATVKPFDFGYADKFNYVNAEAAVPAVPTPVGASSSTIPSAIPPVPNIPPVTSQLPPIDTAKFGTEYLYSTMPGSVLPTPPAPPAAPLYGSGSQVPTYTGQSTFPNIVPSAPAPTPTPVVETPSLGGPGTGYRGQAVQIGSGSDATPYTAAELQTMSGSAAPPQEPGGLQSLYKDFMNMPLKDKLMTGMAGSVAYDMLNKPKPYEKEKYKSTFKPGLYSGYTPVQPTPYQPNYAGGGLADLGGYSDGGRMLKGPGDGMSDDIPATIANKQPARLANEEFVIPADVVSHLGNGSSEAGAKQLYKMMERVRKARTGNKKQGKQINPEKYLA